jgi:putative resolvase
MNNLITIKEASELLGVSPKTLRRWEKQGKITPIRTAGGHRRFRMTDILGCQQETDHPLTVGYARVSHLEQRKQLDHQIEVLEAVCKENNQPYEILSDIGSGVSHQRPGLLRLIELICDRRVRCLILPDSERLGRFCSDLIFGLCHTFGTQVILLNHPGTIESEEELLEDIQDIVTLCYSRLYYSGNPQYEPLLGHLRSLKDTLVA